MTDVLAAPPERDFERDRLGRPYISHPDGGRQVTYTRCTTFIGVLENRYMLERWQQRMVIHGLVERPDLVLSAAAHINDRDELNRIAEQAQEAAKSHAKAVIGTALHKFTADLDRGLTLGRVPGDWQEWIDEYRRVTAPLRHILIEEHVVLDELQIAGTPDRVVEFPPGSEKYYIADLKTGDITRAGKIAMQLAVYARSVLYDVQTHQRREYPVPVSHRAAIVLEVNQDTNLPVRLNWVNIAKGWEDVQLAARVRESQRGQAKLIAPIGEK